LQPPLARAVFSKRLKEARALRGISQRALGDLLGLGKAVGSARINRYEQQTSSPDIETATEIARALNVPLAYLYAESDDLAELILACSKLSKAERVRVLSEMRALIKK